ncbi:Putative undecaprenyl-diphosphatase YbjG [Paraburkholderia caffeinitolerans]|uniref:Undecaprenyl-diphosphatase YbjG n=1 Tax=Paraburkholderia caffeinitolerans TaxID=1723730 RepID=A0A6J5FXV1_9BURK|nr:MULTISPECIES: phosphatase PAP2 family protein [Paraburkholderia]CAB3787551.1 Putative undecaprenyl-diphosphatase YbjG [Paraburkholderia caffeinitolerans]
MESLEALNRSLFLAINGTPATPHWLIKTALVVANDLILLVPLALVLMWLSGDARKRAIALRVCVVTLVTLGVNQAIGLAWPHPRPFVIGLGHTFFAHAPDSSFPSDHGTVCSVFVLTLLLGGMVRTGLVALVAGVAIAWSRVFLGVHYPFDMIGALVVSCLVYAVITPVWNACGAALMQFAVTLYRSLLALPIRQGWLRP